MIKQAEVLSQGLVAMRIELSAQQQLLLLDYLELLNKWNRAINLTAIRDPRQMVALQLLDSLTVLPCIRRAPLLDVGSGGGLPGIPLAIARPQLEITLLYSNGKKTRFLSQAKTTLMLHNVSVVQSRIEAWRPAQLPGSITCRALASLRQIIAWTEHLLTPRSEIIAMKGRHPAEELEEIRHLGLDVEIHQVAVPGVAAQRHIVRISGFRHAPP